MRDVQVVIGANWGDEGKGLFTDYFASRGNACVIRHNSSGQATHTVVTPKGDRHVFGHIGAGSLAGADTYFGPEFSVHPISFREEHEKFRAVHHLGNIFCNPLCNIVTPYEMLINQLVETKRGDSKHGSCGFGFGESIERSTMIPFFVDMLGKKPSKDVFVQRALLQIRELYVPGRLETLGFDPVDIPDKFKKWFTSDDIFNHFLADLDYFVANTNVSSNHHLLSYDRLVFESAQGLLLDQNHSFFPHVTRSNTGIDNVLAITNDIGITSDEMTVNYITRCYMNRHGAGPFPTEHPMNRPYKHVRDDTNNSNLWQGSVRFGILDADLMFDAIQKDIEKQVGGTKLRIAITCLDHIEEENIIWKYQGKIRKTPKKEFCGELSTFAFGSRTWYESNGPTRNDIKRHTRT